MKKYRAKIDTIIEGRPIEAEADVPNAGSIPEERLDGYLKAGLIEEVKPKRVEK